MHKNPIVREQFIVLFRDVQIFFLEPFDYGGYCCYEAIRAYFVRFWRHPRRGPSAGKPVLVLRETTERSEGIDAGTSKLVELVLIIFLMQLSLLTDKEEYENVKAINPYDGKASKKIPENV